MNHLARPALVVGLLTEAIYLAAVTGPFSFLAHGQNLLDLGKLTGYSSVAAIAVTVGLLGLFLFYALALRDIAANGQSALPLALIGTLVFSVTLVFMYPVTAIDVYNYAVQGHVAFFYHVNPLAAAPSSITGDPFVAYGSTWADTTSPYGPIWIFLSIVDAWLAGPNVIIAVLALKGLAALAIVGTAGLLAWAAQRAGRNPALAVVYFGWNPLVLIELAGNGHNDAVLTLFVVAGLILARHRWPTLAVACLTAAVLVKSLPIAAIPLLFVWLLSQHGSFWRLRVPTIFAAFIVMLSVLVAGYAPFWAGWETLARLREVNANYLASIPALIVLLVPNATDWLTIPQMAVLSLVGLSLVWLVWQRRVSLERAVVEIIFATILVATHFAGWYLPLLIGVAALTDDSWVWLRMVVFTFTTTLTTPLWQFVFPWTRDWLSMEAFHLIVVPWTFLPPLAIGLWELGRARTAKRRLASPVPWPGPARELATSRIRDAG